jgi:hypothetical protein
VWTRLLKTHFGTSDCSNLVFHDLLTYLFTYLLTYLRTYLLTPWSRVLLEKLTGLELDKKFPAFYWIRRFITSFAIARHLSLSWASPIQSTSPHPTSWRSILILSSHLRLGLPSGLFPSGFPIKTLHTPLFHDSSVFKRLCAATRGHVMTHVLVGERRCAWAKR